MSTEGTEPIWARSDVQSAAKTVAKNETAQNIAKSQIKQELTAHEGDVLVSMDPEEYRLMKNKYHMYVQLAYSAVSILMIVAALLELQDGTDPNTAFICFYVLFFACVIFWFEVGPCCGLRICARSYKDNCGFMYSSIGRVLFLAFVCAWLYHLDTLGQVAMGLLGGATVLNIYVIYRFPKFPEYLIKSHALLAKNPTNEV